MWGRRKEVKSISKPGRQLVSFAQVQADITKAHRGEWEKIVCNPDNNQFTGQLRQMGMLRKADTIGIPYEQALNLEIMASQEMGGIVIETPQISDKSTPLLEAVKYANRGETEKVLALTVEYPELSDYEQTLLCSATCHEARVWARGQMMFEGAVNLELLAQQTTQTINELGENMNSLYDRMGWKLYQSPKSEIARAINGVDLIKSALRWSVMVHIPNRIEHMATKKVSLAEIAGLAKKAETIDRLSLDLAI